VDPRAGLDMEKILDPTGTQSPTPRPVAIPTAQTGLKVKNDYSRLLVFLGAGTLSSVTHSKEHVSELGTVSVLR
jgi:hypothetical protein